ARRQPPLLPRPLSQEATPQAPPHPGAVRSPAREPARARRHPALRDRLAALRRSDARRARRRADARQRRRRRLRGSTAVTASATSSSRGAASARSPLFGPAAAASISVLPDDDAAPRGREDDQAERDPVPRER